MSKQMSQIFVVNICTKMKYSRWKKEMRESKGSKKVGMTWNEYLSLSIPP